MEDAQLKAAIIAMDAQMPAPDDDTSEQRLRSLRVRAVAEGVYAATGRREHDVKCPLAQQLLEELDQRGLVRTDSAVWADAIGFVGLEPAALVWAAMEPTTDWPTPNS